MTAFERTSPAATSPRAPTVRPAEARDVDAIVGVVDPYVRRQLLLPRTHAEVAGEIGTWRVAELDGTVVGCVALRDFGGGIGEVRSLSVAEATRGRGIGALLLEAAVRDARGIGIRRLFAITRSPGFFVRHRFAELAMEEVPVVLGADRVPWPRPIGDGHAMEQRL